MPVCIKHTSIIWNRIKDSKKARMNVSVFWLDLANSYGAVPHPLIWKALKAFHVNQSILKMLKQYSGGFKMCFMAEDNTT